MKWTVQAASIVKILGEKTIEDLKVQKSRPISPEIERRQELVVLLPTIKKVIL